MGCGCKNETPEEVKGESIEFVGFESGEDETVSVDEAIEEGEEAEELRG